MFERYIFISRGLVYWLRRWINDGKSWFLFWSQDSNRYMNFRFQEAMNSSSVQIAVEFGVDLPLIRRTVEWWKNCFLLNLKNAEKKTCFIFQQALMHCNFSDKLKIFYFIPNRPLHLVPVSRSVSVLITHLKTMLSQIRNYTALIKSRVGLSSFDAIQVLLSVSIWCLSFRRLRRTRFYGTTQDLIDDLQQMENEEAFVDGTDLRSANSEVWVALMKVLNGKKTNNVAMLL